MRSYIETLADSYVVLVLYAWKADSGTSDLAKDKKLYFGDPLLHTVTADRVAGLRPDPHAQVENAVALALFRRYEAGDRAPETFAHAELLHLWSTRAGGEIDFVAGRRSEVHVAEVADRTKLSRSKATGPCRALPGRPAVVVSRDELVFGRHYNLIPAPLFLWAISDQV